MYRDPAPRRIVNAVLVISWIALIALAYPGCAAPDEDVYASELDFDDGTADDASGLLGTTTVQYEGSCEFLRQCSVWSRNAGEVTWGCGGTGCSATDRFVAAPKWRDYLCGDRVTVCLEGTTTCTTAEVRDVSCCGRWEASGAVLADLGVSFGENVSTCSG